LIATLFLNLSKCFIIKFHTSIEPAINNNNDDKRKKASLDILPKVDSYDISSDDDSSIDIDNMSSTTIHDKAICTQDDLLYTDYSNSNGATHKSDVNDTYWDEDLGDLSADSSLSLYKNAHTSPKFATTTIMSMIVELNFSKSAVERILKVFKSLTDNICFAYEYNWCSINIII
jgi:hypothetical protein